MTRWITITVVLTIVFAAGPDTFAQAPDAPGQASAPAQAAEPTTQESSTAKSDPDSVACEVNGHAIRESDIAEACSKMIEARSRGRNIPEPQLSQFRERLRPQVLEGLVDAALFNKEAEKEKVAVTEQDLRTELEKRVRGHLLRNSLTREAFETQIRDNLGLSFDEFVAQQISDTGFKDAVLQTRVLQKKFADELGITPEEVAARYEKDRERAYTKAEQVKASHILIPTEQGATEEDIQAAMKKAEGIYADIQKPDADFAALAKEHSSCPSKTKGGDLGFFPRTGAMVEPFAAAAFDLQPGQISNVVKTRFGFHIIKVTERKEASVVTLEQADETIRDELLAEKSGKARERYLEELRKSADIKYADAAAPEAGS